MKKSKPFPSLSPWNSGRNIALTEVLRAVVPPPEDLPPPPFSALPGAGTGRVDPTQSPPPPSPEPKETVPVSKQFGEKRRQMTHTEFFGAVETLKKHKDRLEACPNYAEATRRIDKILREEGQTVPTNENVTRSIFKVLGLSPKRGAAGGKKKGGSSAAFDRIDILARALGKVIEALEGFGVEVEKGPAFLALLAHAKREGPAPQPSENGQHAD